MAHPRQKGALHADRRRGVDEACDPALGSQQEPRRAPSDRGEEGAPDGELLPQDHTESTCVDSPAPPPGPPTLPAITPSFQQQRATGRLPELDSACAHTTLDEVAHRQSPLRDRLSFRLKPGRKKGSG